jgi:hypothetical protein
MMSSNREPLPSTPNTSGTLVPIAEDEYCSTQSQPRTGKRIQPKSKK